LPKCIRNNHAKKEMAMDRFYFPQSTGKYARAIWLAIALAACPVPSKAAERAVLGEESTATW
jgi:hypothetical protein